MPHCAAKVRATTDPIVGPFQIAFAVGTTDRFDEYRLRYEVFVEECHFKDANADRLERDEYDAASCSLMVRDAATGTSVACQRLILPDALPASLLTSFEHEYQPLPGEAPIEIDAICRHSWAEVSRTTVAPKYRWGSAATPMPTLMAVKYASIALAVAFERTTLFSMSEPRMARLIRRLGFPMIQVGSAVEFYGLRAPFRMDVAAMLHSVPNHDRETLGRLIDSARSVAAREVVL